MSEPNTLAGQTIKIWSFYKVIPRKTHVSPSHVVHEDQHNVRKGGVKSVPCDVEAEDRQKASDESHRCEMPFNMEVKVCWKLLFAEKPSWKNTRDGVFIDIPCIEIL